MRKAKNLRKAWAAVQRNARSSKSETTKKEIEAFANNADTNLERLQRELQRGTFKFPPAKGVKLPKDKKKGSFRPLVVAKVESRIVQRAIHDVLITVPSIKGFVHTPHSFGGVTRSDNTEFAAVPAAIAEVLKSISDGGKFIIRSDITSFFTRISKPQVIRIVEKAVDDPIFVKLFESAITVELENMATLRGDAQSFPIHDIGVAQGNSLSPLLGNLILYEFDKHMNGDGIRCIRYIDDFILIAPSHGDAERAFRRATAALKALGMAVSDEKTQRARTDEPFEFLGIEFANGLLRPSRRSRERLIRSIQTALSDSIKGMRQYSRTGRLDKEHSLIETLNRLQGIMQGWGKHYKFCNDAKIFNAMDSEIQESLKMYFGVYRKEREKAGSAAGWQYLGIEALGQLRREPFRWPKTSK